MTSSRHRHWRGGHRSTVPEQLAPAPGAVCSTCVQMGVASDEWGPSGLFQDISWWFLFVLPSNGSSK